jgi:uncharacterized lipoprotein YajG
MMKTHSLLIALFASSVLAACGSDSPIAAAATPAPAPAPAPVPAPAVVDGTQVPVTATQDAASAIAFVMQIVAKGESNAEDPVVLGNANLATSDVIEPVTII